MFVCVCMIIHKIINCRNKILFSSFSLLKIEFLYLFLLQTILGLQLTGYHPLTPLLFYLFSSSFISSPTFLCPFISSPLATSWYNYNSHSATGELHRVSHYGMGQETPQRGVGAGGMKWQDTLRPAGGGEGGQNWPQGTHGGGGGGVGGGGGGGGGGEGMAHQWQQTSCNSVSLG